MPSICLKLQEVSYLEDEDTVFQINDDLRRAVVSFISYTSLFPARIYRIIIPSKLRSATIPARHLKNCHDLFDFHNLHSYLHLTET